MSQQSKTAQRAGASHERMIGMANRLYALRGKGVISKVPTGTRPVKGRGGKTEWIPAEKTGCDYLGVYKSTAVALEAKSSSNQTNFPLFSYGRKPNVKPHQMEFLRSFEKAGGKSFILIYFSKLDRFFRVSIGEFEALQEQAVQAGRKSVPLKWLEEEAFEVEREGNFWKYLDQI